MANLFDKLKNIFGGPVSVPNVQTTQGRRDVKIQDKLNQLNSKGNQDVDLTKPETVATLYQCAKLLSEFVSRIPIDIYSQAENGRKTVLKNHRWYYPLKYSPNNFTSSQSLIATMIVHLCFRGNAFALINPDYTLTLLNPDDVLAAKVYQNTLYYLVSLTQADGTEKQDIIEAENLVHVKFASKDGLFGMAPVTSLIPQINVNAFSNITTKNFFAKNASSTKYLQQLAVNGKPSNTTIGELIQNLSDKIAGYANNFNLFAVPDGYNIVELGLNTELVKFLDAGRITRNEIAGVMGIPVFFLNTEPNYTTKFEEQNLLFLSTIENIVNIIRSEAEQKLLFRSEKIAGITIEWDYTKLNQANTVDKANALKLIFQSGGLSPNQFARAFNLPESDNPNMDLHYIQSQNVAIEFMKPEVIDVTNSNAGTDENNPKESI